MIYRLYDIGVDALIIQDLGLLECNLPPIELHASTQCHNAGVERIKFLEQVGFSRVVLARETSLEQMRQVRAATSVDLEAFVHGALCVSYSGQCYMSQYLNGRSGNRGCCSQPCRSSYDLCDGSGRLLIKDRHLLSLRDFNASQHLCSMIDAGVTSFKIEGRLKDLSYVKNVTAFYRQLLDSMMNGHEASSSGRCTFFFTPDLDRTFNRGYTDYFLTGRQPMASFETQKSRGKYVGKVKSVRGNALEIDGSEVFTNGDGLCFIGADGRMQGFLVNAVNGQFVIPNKMLDISAGTILWRNNDQRFEKILQGKTAERKIPVNMCFISTDGGFALDVKDADGLSASSFLVCEYTPSNDSVKAKALIVKQLSKTGDTPFSVSDVIDKTDGAFFVPASSLNQLRRDALIALSERRMSHFRPADSPLIRGDATYYEEALDYRANVVNAKAEAFYKHHGVKKIERGVEQTLDYTGKALMTTKYCLRYELGCCLKGKCKGKPKVSLKASDSLVLRNNDHRFRLEFDCSECLMRIYAID
jgi:putative protease